MIEYLKVMNNLLACQNVLLVGLGKGSYIKKIDIVGIFWNGCLI